MPNSVQSLTPKNLQSDSYCFPHTQRVCNSLDVTDRMVSTSTASAGFGLRQTNAVVAVRVPAFRRSSSDILILLEQKRGPTTNKPPAPSREFPSGRKCMPGSRRLRR